MKFSTVLAALFFSIGAFAAPAAVPEMGEVAENNLEKRDCLDDCIKHCPGVGEPLACLVGKIQSTISRFIKNSD
ncbi:hypothetical protein FQN54_002680 [Arachnomyces sp. PD_36]|nr:hypothetical protein FQN54_002680 [Arachnomyces sp. PD_36]